ncbi:glycodelin-like [Gorilla gorilla gorilla]|uniref:glycodelin-like n=1 Tax=Gorilla gorilla gorilla TaxID=9595 RepID=UPI00123EA8EA|nr:glycodelin-like [Gorilla gorilla gorilla]
MQCLLLTLSMALVCAIQARDIPQTKQDVELPKLAGTWHSMAMVASDFSLLETVEAPLRVNITSLWPTPEGNLEIILHRWEHHKCVERTVLAQKTEDPAVFMVNPRTLEADDKVMEEFISFLRTLPVHMWIFLDITQAEEQCRV